MATDKTTNSIADNVIDPTFYVQGGGIGTSTNLKGQEVQKLGFENIPEDWVMYVQLFVKPRNRSVLMRQVDGSMVVSDHEQYKVADIPYYKTNINKNDSGNIIPYDIQTTEYTDIFGAKELPMTQNRTPNTLGQESAFGISSINIDFNNVRQPSIDINFVDIRGACRAVIHCVTAPHSKILRGD